MPLHDLFPTSAISSVASDGTRSWERYFGDDSNRSTDEGNLILSIKDLYSENPGSTVAAWASRVGFSLDDLSATGAETMLLFRTIYKALADVPSDSPLVLAMRAVNLGGPRSLLPDFRVTVDGSFAVSSIVDTFCGPFTDARSWLTAIDERLLLTSPLRRAE
ncbi:hypothetical protein DEU34_1338 [Microbacterium sp. AG1240]|uniref:hypothetical protein n=1 Tax=Microbacterium sp. AG1240 TaxID=2183992 RepID=UPI000EB25F37|nr:hypothetical protein [Microbacterium sp. AG1240]RKT36812.1 hypothetical protein DEU34_1338 [Microbacterium sp. AG1240]